MAPTRLRRARIGLVTSLALGLLAMPAVASADTPATATVAASTVRFDPFVLDLGQDAPAAAPARRTRTHAFAEIADTGVRMRLPSPHVEYVGFHEGSSTGVPMRPVLGRKEVPTSVMPSRGRAASPTSAVDIALAEDRVVRAPVTGTVVRAESYTLYGTTRDLLVEIVPDDADVTVRLLHVRKLRVAPGDRVEAGRTAVAGSPRQLPFSSQVDRFVGHVGPHVHIQVQPR